jgi:hypothetical protein
MQSGRIQNLSVACLHYPRLANRAMIAKRLRQQKGELCLSHPQWRSSLLLSPPRGANVMRWISTFDPYDLIVAAAISVLFAVALSLSLGFI